MSSPVSDVEVFFPELGGKTTNYTAVDIYLLMSDTPHNA